jgi:hypothetical protein
VCGATAPGCSTEIPPPGESTNHDADRSDRRTTRVNDPDPVTTSPDQSAGQERIPRKGVTVHQRFEDRIVRHRDLKAKVADESFDHRRAESSADAIGGLEEAEAKPVAIEFASSSKSGEASTDDQNGGVRGHARSRERGRVTF